MDYIFVVEQFQTRLLCVFGPGVGNSLELCESRVVQGPVHLLSIAKPLRRPRLGLCGCEAARIQNI